MLQYPALLLEHAKKRAESIQAMAPPTSLPTQQDEVLRLMILACDSNRCLIRQQLLKAHPAAGRSHDGHISRLVKSGNVFRTGQGQLFLTWQGLEAFLRTAVWPGLCMASCSLLWLAMVALMQL